MGNPIVPARIQCRGHTANVSALPGRIPSFVHHDKRDSFDEQLVLQALQLLLPLLGFFLLRFLRQLLVQIHFAQFGHGQKRNGVGKLGNRYGLRLRLLGAQISVRCMQSISVSITRAVTSDFLPPLIANHGAYGVLECNSICSYAWCQAA